MAQGDPNPEHKAKGWFPLYRSVVGDGDDLWRECREKGDWAEWVAWLYLLSETHYGHEPRQVPYYGRDGREEGSLTIRRGEFCISERRLAHVMGWGDDERGRSKARRYFAKMERLGRIAVVADNAERASGRPTCRPTCRPTWMIRKVCNWAAYNFRREAGGQPDGQPADPILRTPKKGAARDRKREAMTWGPQTAR